MWLEEEPRRHRANFMFILIERREEEANTPDEPTGEEGPEEPKGEDVSFFEYLYFFPLPRNHERHERHEKKALHPTAFVLFVFFVVEVNFEV